MNLVEKPWIPIVTMEGGKTEASLRDIFHSGNGYADLAVRPHERVALMRLLICIAQAALDGPENFSQWDKVPEILPGKAEAYLKNWQKYFELFDTEQPFLQIAKLIAPKQEKEGVLKKLPATCVMNFSLASGNNTTLFDHRGNDDEVRPLPEAQLALHLVTFQNFAPGGGASIVMWNNVKTKQVGNPDSPCLKGSMYHAFLKGHNLAETIHLLAPPFHGSPQLPCLGLGNRNFILISGATDIGIHACGDMEDGLLIRLNGRLLAEQGADVDIIPLVLQDIR